MIHFPIGAIWTISFVCQREFSLGQSFASSKSISIHTSEKSIERAADYVCAPFTTLFIEQTSRNFSWFRAGTSYASNERGEENSEHCDLDAVIECELFAQSGWCQRRIFVRIGTLESNDLRPPFARRRIVQIKNEESRNGEKVKNKRVAMIEVNEWCAWNDIYPNRLAL